MSLKPFKYSSIVLTLTLAVKFEWQVNGLAKVLHLMELNPRSFPIAFSEQPSIVSSDFSGFTDQCPMLRKDKQARVPEPHMTTIA